MPKLPEIAEMLRDATLRPPDIVFEREHQLDLGGVRVRLLWLGPSHTVGDTLAFVDDDQVLYAGDVVLKNRFPSFGPQSQRTAWIDVLDKVKALKPRIIVSSHGDLADAATIDMEKRVLNQMHDRVSVLKAEGRSLEETSKIVVAEFRAKYPGWQSTVPNEIGPIVRSLYSE
jgi:glyoxylase-like metal-dependent hydrolase (beta-lactamase superfamily II)